MAGVFRNILLSVITLQFALYATAALYEHPSQVPRKKNYDYIIVGGGAGGGVLANRLSEEPGLNVLLIEAGSSDFRDINITVPRFASRLPNSRFDWNITTANQPSLNGRRIQYTRGFVLGGSTALNFMVYTRGSRDDYDRWANVTDDEGWSWNSLEPYFRKLERLVPPTDGRDTTGEIDPALHGHSGPLRFSLPGVLQPTDDLVLNTSAQLSCEFPFNLDYNSGDTMGVGWGQYTIAHGGRISSAVAYIAPAFSRRNLDVLVNTRATKILQTGAASGVPVFRTVQFSSSLNATTYTLNASREVILSAGAVETPHILMLSGIGDSSYLYSHAIRSIVDLPDVGHNLQDHTQASVLFKVNSTNTQDRLMQDAAFFEAQEALWKINRAGLLGTSASSQLGWLRLQGNASIFHIVPDPSAGATSGHYEFILANGFRSNIMPFPSDGGYFFTILTVILSPTSRGNISLSSSNPFEPPVVDPNLLGTEFDIYTMRESIKAARRFAAAPPWNGWILEEYGPLFDAHSDEEIDQYARNTSNTLFHPSGTAAMGKTGSRGRGSGALNSDLTVKGTKGLRVVDASAFPFIIAGHTQAAVYVLAERASDLIKSTLKDAL